MLYIYNISIILLLSILFYPMTHARKRCVRESVGQFLQTPDTGVVSGSLGLAHQYWVHRAPRERRLISLAVNYYRIMEIS